MLLLALLSVQSFWALNKAGKLHTVRWTQGRLVRQMYLKAELQLQKGIKTFASISCIFKLIFFCGILLCFQGECCLLGWSYWGLFPLVGFFFLSFHVSENLTQAPISASWILNSWSWFCHFSNKVNYMVWWQKNGVWGAEKNMVSLYQETPPRADHPVLSPGTWWPSRNPGGPG